MMEEVENLTVPEVCALQWKNCVEHSAVQLSQSKNPVLTIVYEDFVREPLTSMNNILDFIGLSVNEQDLGDAVSNISGESVGKGEAFISSHPNAGAIIGSVDAA